MYPSSHLTSISSWATNNSQSSALKRPLLFILLHLSPYTVTWLCCSLKMLQKKFNNYSILRFTIAKENFTKNVYFTAFFTCRMKCQSSDKVENSAGVDDSKTILIKKDWATIRLATCFVTLDVWNTFLLQVLIFMSSSPHRSFLTCQHGGNSGVTNRAENLWVLWSPVAPYYLCAYFTVWTEMSESWQNPYSLRLMSNFRNRDFGWSVDTIGKHLKITHLS